jgi:hypothetical protein
LGVGCQFGRSGLAAFGIALIVLDVEPDWMAQQLAAQIFDGDLRTAP